MAGYQPSRVTTPPLTHSCWLYVLVWLFPTVCFQMCPQRYIVTLVAFLQLCTTMGCVRFRRWVGINPSSYPTHSCRLCKLVWLFPTVCVSSKIHCLICTTMGCVRFGRWVGINPSLTHSSRPSVPRCVVRTNGVFDHTRERVDCVDS